eukprot:493421-Pleurochrysis_carterae.AAC.4
MEPHEDSGVKHVEHENECWPLRGAAGESSASRMRAVPLERRVDGTPPRSSLRAMSKETMRP